MNLQVDKKEPVTQTNVEEDQNAMPKGVPALTSLYLYISGSCNLACRHCWIEPNYIPGGKGGQFIPIEYVQKVIKESLSLGLQSIKLTGGEPTLHPQFRDIVKLVERARLDIQMETNGLLIDRDLAQFIKSNSYFSHISVSLDGANAATHEALRLIPGSFMQAIQGIRNLRSVGISPQLICSLYKGNHHQVKAMVDLAAELGCRSIKFNIIQSTGRGDDLIKSEGLSVPELIELYSFIENNVIPSTSISVLYDIPLAFRPLRAMLGGEIGHCNILNIIGLLSNGDISLCGIGVTIPELVFGNISRNNMKEVWINSPGLQNLRELIPNNFMGICGDCIHNNYCLGACIANNYHVTGFINQSYSFCAQAEKLNSFPASRRISYVK